MAAGRSILLRLIADNSDADKGLSETERRVKRFGQLKAEARADIKTEAANAKLDVLNKRMARLGAQEQTPEVKIRTAGTLRQIERVEKELGKVGRATDHAGGRLRTAFGKVGAVGAAVGVTYGLSQAIGSVVTQTVGFDRAMRNVNSIAQLSERQLKTLRVSVLHLAGETAQAPHTLAEGLYDLVSSGFNAKQSLLILRSSAKAATAGLTDTATSTKAVAAVLNAYHRPAKDAADISDTLFQTVNLGVISFEQLSQTIGDVLPFASSLGVSLNEVGAATATLTKAGISPEETMTRIKNVMVAMLKPSDDLQKAFDDLGVKSGEALIKQKGFQGALEAVVGTTDGTKAAVAGLFPNIRGLGGALALTGKNAQGAEKDLKGFKDTGGATDKALSQQAKSISYQWNKAKAEFAEVAITLGTKLVPFATKALKATSKFVQQMIDGKDAGGRFVHTLRRIAHTIGRIVGFLNDHKSAIKLAIGAWAIYKAAAIAAVAETRLRLIGSFLGLGPKAAAGGTAAGRRFGTAFNIAAAALIVAELPNILATIGDEVFGKDNAFSEEARRRGFRDLGGLATPESAGLPVSQERRQLAKVHQRLREDRARHTPSGADPAGRFEGGPRPRHRRRRLGDVRDSGVTNNVSIVVPGGGPPDVNALAVKLGRKLDAQFG